MGQYSDGSVFVKTKDGDYQIPGNSFPPRVGALSEAQPPTIRVLLWKSWEGHFIGISPPVYAILGDRIVGLSHGGQPEVLGVYTPTTSRVENEEFIRAIAASPKLLAQLNDHLTLKRSIREWMLTNVDVYAPEILDFDTRMELMCDRAKSKISAWIREQPSKSPTYLRFYTDDHTDLRLEYIDGGIGLTTGWSGDVVGNVDLNVRGNVNLLADNFTLDVREGGKISLAPSHRPQPTKSTFLNRLTFLVTAPIRTLRWLFTGR